jgi:nucleotide-binding universal stress UspA family protein
MNSIIVCTDFSDAADNAMHYAANLARRIHADIVLLHVYMIPITLSETPVVVISGEELKKNADDGLERCKRELLADNSGLQIRTESRLGDVLDELEEMSKEVNPYAVVMGTHGASGIEKVIFGSTTASVMRHLKRPVIAVPVGYKFNDIKTIVLATDLKVKDHALGRMVEIIKGLNSTLYIIHVTNKDVEGKNFPDSLTQHLSFLNPGYDYIKNDDVSDGIQKYVDEKNADLLLIFQHEYTFWEKMFQKQHTADLLYNITIPVLSIHD